MSTIRCRAPSSTPRKRCSCAAAGCESISTKARLYLKAASSDAGDVILLVAGGHGFEVLEEIEMVEVKQGPYVGDTDKTRFRGISRRTRCG